VQHRNVRARSDHVGRQPEQRSDLHRVHSHCHFASRGGELGEEEGVPCGTQLAGVYRPYQMVAAGFTVACAIIKTPQGNVSWTESMSGRARAYITRSRAMAPHCVGCAMTPVMVRGATERSIDHITSESSNCNCGFNLNDSLPVNRLRVGLSHTDRIGTATLSKMDVPETRLDAQHKS